MTAYLVDTSVLTRLHQSAVRAALEVLDDVRYSPVAGLEYRFQASNAREWDGLGIVLDGFDRAAWRDADGVFRRADDVQRLLASRGLKGRRVPDLIIAAHAEAEGLTVLHYDADYDHIAEVTGQSTQWIVERGSID